MTPYLNKNKNAKAYLFFIMGMLLLFGSCKFNSEMQTEGASYLQGEWKQDSIPNQHQMLQYTLTDFRFTCDSIYARMYVHAKTKQITDSCYNNGSWVEYAKGLYVVRGDSVIVDGIYVKENGKQKVSGCYRQGQYLPRFKVAFHSKDSLVLENKYDQRPIILRKTKDVICVPQKRWQ